jgi:hypothetical protein
MYSKTLVSIRHKASASYTCCECGSTEFIQAHHVIPKDDSSIIVLCAICHHKKHPDLALGLFTNKRHQPYWENKSVYSLSREMMVHPRTIVRRAKKLGITEGVLTQEKEQAIRDYIIKYKPVERVIYSPISDYCCPKCHADLVKAGMDYCKMGAVQRFMCKRRGCYMVTNRPMIKEEVKLAKQKHN